MLLLNSDCVAIRAANLLPLFPEGDRFACQLDGSKGVVSLDIGIVDDRHQLGEEEVSRELHFFSPSLGTGVKLSFHEGVLQEFGADAVRVLGLVTSPYDRLAGVPIDLVFLNETYLESSEFRPFALGRYLRVVLEVGHSFNQSPLLPTTIIPRLGVKVKNFLSF